MATCVQTPLLEREIVDIFIGTLQGQYYKRMLGNVSLEFSDLVIIGEQIEDGLKNGKIQGASNG